MLILGLNFNQMTIVLRMLISMMLMLMMMMMTNEEAPISVLAPLARRLLHTAVELFRAAQYMGVGTSPCLSLAPLLGSAPLLSSRSAESQAWHQQARDSGVTWGGVWEGRLPHLF